MKIRYTEINVFEVEVDASTEEEAIEKVKGYLCSGSHPDNSECLESAYDYFERA